MNRYRIERALVLTIGFVLGVGLAVCIAPGDVLLWVLAGAFLGLFCHEQFINEFRGELFWRRSHRRHSTR